MIRSPEKFSPMTCWSSCPYLGCGWGCTESPSCWTCLGSHALMVSVFSARLYSVHHFHCPSQPSGQTLSHSTRRTLMAPCSCQPPNLTHNSSCNHLQMCFFAPHPFSILGIQNRAFWRAFCTSLVSTGIWLWEGVQSPLILWIRGQWCSFLSSQMVSVVKDLCSEHTGQEQRPNGVNIQALQMISSECWRKHRDKDKDCWCFL